MVKYRLQIIIYSLLGIVSVVFGLLSSVVSRNLIDAVTGFNHDSIAVVAAAYVGFGVGSLVLNLITGKISLLISTKVSNEISADIFDQVLYTDWESVSDYTAGDLLQRINGDSGSISTGVLSLIPNAVNALVNFIGAFIILICNDPIMAIIALAGAPVVFLSGQRRLARSKQFQLESRKIASKKTTFNNETFQNLQTIKAFGVLSQFSQKMREIQQDVLEVVVKQYNYQAWTQLCMSLVSLIVGYACYGFAVYRLWNHSISYGTMTLFISMAGTLSSSFSSVVRVIPSAVHTATSAERIMEIIEMPREEYANQAEVDRIKSCSKDTGVCVSMKDVSFAYKDGRSVYANSSMEANPGEIVALVGPSGQGKTTTLRLILSLLSPQEGEVRVGNPGGEETYVSPASRKLFCYVPQGNTMFYGTIAENLRMVKPEATDEEIQRVLEMACAWEFVSQLPDGIESQVGQRGHGFSEGQNQRLSIARSILADAPILLLDEATSALDVLTERKVLRNIMKAEKNKTIIVTTHRPSVLEVCTRVYYIADQKIEVADQGKIDEMVKDF